MSKMMKSLKADSFASMQRKTDRGKSNIEPRQTNKRQPAVRLSTRGFDWLEKRLQEAFEVYRKLPRHELDKINWPKRRDALFTATA